ncbi:MAG: hypothetical protein PWP51_2768 [Clostridiales bacterium]|jgi:hypothetical protein|nr:hypothetical protein [Clostridiales bacterium]
MKLKIFRDFYLFRPLQIIVIDRPLELDGTQMHVIALTYEEEAYSLWVVTHIPNEMDEKEATIKPLTQTNRDIMNERSFSNIRAIERLEIGDNIFSFDCIRTEAVHFNGSQTLHRLQYFIEQGVEFHQWNDVDLSKLHLTKHECSTSTPMVDINLMDKKIKLNFRPYQKETEVYYKYSVDFNIEKPVKLKYFDCFDKKEAYFYVHKFETYTLEDYIFNRQHF